MVFFADVEGRVIRYSDDDPRVFSELVNGTWAEPTAPVNPGEFMMSTKLSPEEVREKLSNPNI